MPYTFTRCDQMRYAVATLTLAAALLAGGCGQMGPLYEPEEVPPPPTAPAAATTTATNPS